MNVAVFLSQYDVGQTYAGVARATGKAIAQGKHTLVFGGGDEGLMHIIAMAAHEDGGRIVSVIREPIKHKAYKEADETIVVADAKEMNLGLISRADAIVVLPGGIGTLNELTEVVRMKKNGQADKPIAVVSTAGFYDGLRVQLERMAAEGFLREDVARSVRFAATPAEAIGYIEGHGTD